jgi:hypothetical protein
MVLRPPSEEDLNNSRGQFINLYGFAEKYLNNENILRRYQVDLLFRYV